MGLLALLLANAVLCCVPALCHKSKEQVFHAQDPDHPDKSTVVAITYTHEGSTCEVFSDVNLNEVIRNIPDYQPTHRIPWQHVQQLLNECTMLYFRREFEPTDSTSVTAPHPNPENEHDGWVIFPGTKWCGPGDKAENYDDLGLCEDTDRCCRAHDKCDDLIEGGGTKHNLTNVSSFTKLNCNCDDELYDCLSSVNSLTSNTLGNAYFNILRTPCYYYDYPITDECKSYFSFLKLTCLEYKRDTKAEKVWQWREAKMYKQLPVPLPIDVSLSF